MRRGHRALATLASVLLVVWSLCVPFLHGHLPTATAHLHGASAHVAAARGTAHGEGSGSLSSAIGAAHVGDALGETPLPLAWSAAAFVLVALLLLVGTYGERPEHLAARRVPVASARGSPIGRFEVVQV